MIDLKQYGDCQSDLLGSGLPVCDIPLFGDLLGMGLFSKGTSFSIADDTLDLAAWKTKMKELKLFPYTGLYNFAQNTPENERATSSTGILSIIRNGKPFYSVSFDKGSCLHKSLYNKKGNSRWDIALIFEKGILLQIDIAKTKLTGFDASIFDVDTYKFLQGTDPEMSTAVFQFRNAEAFNSRHIFLTWEQLGFDANAINGVIDTEMEYTTAPSAATTFSVKVTAGCNKSAVITSLADEAFWVLGGTQTSATAISTVAYNTATESYDFTLDTALVATDTVKPRLGAGSVLVAENAIEELYKGSAPLATVT